jgi:osmotically-inducible protein OsmY
MRADAEIFAEARHALDDRPTIPATVRVHVDHGVVTLTGSVRLTSQQLAAAEVVQRIPGVRRLVNDIVVAELPSVQGFEPPNDRG